MDPQQMQELLEILRGISLWLSLIATGVVVLAAAVFGENMGKLTRWILEE